MISLCLASSETFGRINCNHKSDCKGEHQAVRIMAHRKDWIGARPIAARINVYYGGGLGVMAKLDQQPLQSIRARGVRVKEKEE